MSTAAPRPSGDTSAHRVVVTGLGLVTALGHSVAEFWDAVMAGRSGTARVESFDVSAYPTQVAAAVRNFDPARWLNTRQIRRAGRSTQFALAAAADALADAGWIGANGGSDFADAATVIGSGYGSMPSVEEAYRIYFTRGWRRNPYLTVPLCMPNAAGSQIALEYRLRGPSFTVSAACSSGSAAVAETFRLIRSGAIRRAVTGGCDAVIIPGVFSIWCLLGVLSTRNHDPAGACSPFSADRDGLVLGEGACLMTLERLDDAAARGAPIYAEIAGIGSNCQAESITAPTVEGETAAIRAGLADAGLAAEEVGYVNAHGTATRLNDVVETRAIHAAFGAHARNLAVSSTKSMIGHAMGASGAIECAVTALALRDQVLPPTINLREVDPECDLDYVPGKARPARFDAAISSTFAFGGSNVILALRRVGG